ncbi:Uncharacterised protein [Mycobacteroides abscessus subsp. massiliense]|uniref:hypothetical protein n=1 Tax=Mycobacteroides abscessus TaxID=36809 RepID=UPI0009A79EA4|nr:hypothetical protein [Mycobacteroides abscessus]SKZ39464.1 Uncharacterised protein [Mycobacteroides abscessus subsp. massiliense]SKZ39650.1 Uncharacterised protein [Mycobacteroides abscessus subsp. massiliense]
MDHSDDAEDHQSEQQGEHQSDADPGPTTIIGPERAEQYLAQMDIAVADVLQAIEAGDIAAGNITDHHPVTAAGLVRWIQLVGVLRRLFAESRIWHRDNPKNRPITRHLKKRYTLSTVGGTEPTGLIDHPSGPRAARKKGSATREAVTSTLALIEVRKLRNGSPSGDDNLAPPVGNWFLVYYRADNEVRWEISLPSGFSDGQFTGWRVRVIPGSWAPDEPAARPLDVGGQDVDFEVREVS